MQFRGCRFIICDFGILQYEILKRWRPRGATLKRREYQKAYATFRERLRDAREKAGLTQAEAASALGQTQPFLSKCESGERRVDFIELKEFARLYKLPLSFFD